MVAGLLGKQTSLGRGALFILIQVNQGWLCFFLCRNWAGGVGGWGMSVRLLSTQSGHVAGRSHRRTADIQVPAARLLERQLPRRSSCVSLAAGRQETSGLRLGC